MPGGLTLRAVDSDGMEQELRLVLSASYHKVNQHGDFVAGAVYHPVVAESPLERMLTELAASPLTMFPRLCVHHAVTGHSFHLLPAIFPRITTLTLASCECQGAELLGLRALSLLRVLRFENDHTLAPAALLELCSGLQALELLVCRGCPGINRSAAKSIEAAVGKGLRVQHAESFEGRPFLLGP